MPEPKKMKREDVEQALANAEYEKCDNGTIIDILLGGCRGYENMPNDELEEFFMREFGEEIKIVEG